MSMYMLMQAQMQMQVPRQRQLSYLGGWGRNSLAGYFHLPDNVVAVLRRGDTSQRLAHRILSELYDSDITADDVLALTAGQDLAGVNAAKRISVIRDVFSTYQSGIRKKLRPPLPESVVYTFAHLEAELNKIRMAPAFKKVFKVEVFNADGKLVVSYPDISIENMREADAKVLRNANSLTSYVVMKQLRFFESGARGDYLQPLDIFDKKGKLKSLRKLHIREASEDLHISPEKINRLIHAPITQIHTEYGIFPLHFFFRDAAIP